MGVIYETSLYAFVLITIILGGGAAFMIGRATAKGWKPFTQAVIFCAMLGCAIRFLHWGLFYSATYESWRSAKGTLVSPYYYAVDVIFLLAFAAVGFRLQRSSQMRKQYGWLEKKSALSTEV